jgi:phosphatidylserine/phosphatidylglycerophosphate/cardiolipin synthase-like enzyme
MKIFYSFLVSLIAFSLNAQSNIAEARNQAEGSTVTVKGIVTNGSELGDIRYLQDETAGIAAYPGSGSVSGFESVEAGDEIEVTGVLKDFNGLLEISPITGFTILNSSNSIPTPKIITASQMGDEYESQLVQISCVDFNSSGTFNVGGNGAVDSEGESFNIYINSGNSIIGSSIPDDVAHIVGIVTAFNNPQLVIPSTGGVDNEAVCFNITKGPVQLDIQSNSFKMYWETSIPASAIVRWGETMAMENTAELVNLDSKHEFTISGLDDATFYYAQVEAIVDGNSIVSAPGFYSTASNSTGEIRVYFNNETEPSVSSGLFPDGTSPEDVKDAIIERIDLANSTIDLAIYNVNDMDIVDALNDAVVRGVDVRVVADADASNVGLQGNLNFDVLFGNTNGLMHNKFLSIDADSPANAWVIMGSMNFSEQNIYSDYNNVVIFQDQAVAKAYRIEFEEMWGGSGISPVPSNAKFGSAKSDNTPHLFKVGDTYMELYFAPSDQVASKIDAALSTTDNDLSMALLLITQNQFRDKLINLNDGSRWIRGIVESINIVGSDFNALVDAGVDMHHHDESGQFHHKYAIIDYYYNETGRPMVINGSYNWSAAAEERNDENTIIWHSYNMANLFMQEFEARWGESATSVKVEGYEQDLLVYPNPVGDRLTVELEERTFNLLVFNSLGVLVSSLDNCKGLAQIDSDAWSPGVYHLIVQDKDTGHEISAKVIR